MANLYETLTELRYPDGPDEIRKAQTRKDRDTIKWKSVAVGEIVDDIPEISVPWLLKQGKIKKVKAEKQTSHGGGDK